MPDNQTPSEWLQLSSVLNDPDPRGTGLFLVSPDSSKQIEGNVAYEYFVRMCVSNNYFVFKWVPYEIAGLAEIQNQSSQCSTDRCAKTCIKPACLCNTNIGRCS